MINRAKQRAKAYERQRARRLKARAAVMKLFSAHKNVSVGLRKQESPGHSYPT
jgi:hypothetical protein